MALLSPRKSWCTGLFIISYLASLPVPCLRGEVWIRDHNSPTSLRKNGHPVLYPIADPKLVHHATNPQLQILGSSVVVINLGTLPQICGATRQSQMQWCCVSWVCLQQGNVVECPPFANHTPTWCASIQMNIVVCQGCWLLHSVDQKSERKRPTNSRMHRCKLVLSKMNTTIGLQQGLSAVGTKSGPGATVLWRKITVHTAWEWGERRHVKQKDRKGLKWWGTYLWDLRAATVVDTKALMPSLILSSVGMARAISCLETELTWMPSMSLSGTSTKMITNLSVSGHSWTTSIILIWCLWHLSKYRYLHCLI